MLRDNSGVAFSEERGSSGKLKPQAQTTRLEREARGCLNMSIYVEICLSHWLFLTLKLIPVIPMAGNLLINASILILVTGHLVTNASKELKA